MMLLYVCSWSLWIMSVCLCLCVCLQMCCVIPTTALDMVLAATLSVPVTGLTLENSANTKVCTTTKLDCSVN